MTSYLWPHELAEVLRSTKEERSKLTVCAVLNLKENIITLFNGNGNRIIIDTLQFEKANLNQTMEIIDYGNTLKFGDWEADLTMFWE